MRRFCEFLEKHAMKIINFEKEKMIPLTNEGYQSYLNQINYHIFKTNLNMDELMTKTFVRLKIIVIILVNTELLAIAHLIQNIV